MTEIRKTTEYRLEELSAEHEKKAVSWRMVNEKQELMKTRVTKAQKALTELLKLAADSLSTQESSSDNEPGSRVETLQPLVEFVTNEIQCGNLGLPEVANMARTEDSQTAIYSDDFEKLPQEVKDKFGQVEHLINSANHAASESASELNKYEELTQGDNDAALQAAYDAEIKKLSAIAAAERKAEEILGAGTIWKYENRSAPREPKKVRMSPDMSIKLTNNLLAHIEELNNAGLETNRNKLKEEIAKAKEFVQSIKTNLAAYQDVTNLRKVISDVEYTVEMSETHVKNMQRNRIPPEETRSITLNNSDHRARKTSSRTTEDMLNTVLQVKRQKVHQPLSATPAGEPTLLSSSKMISTRPRWAYQDYEEDNPNGKRNRDEERPRDFPSRRRV